MVSPAGDVQSRGTVVPHWRGRSPGKTVWRFLSEPNPVVQYDPEMLLRAVCPTDLKTDVYAKIRTRIFTATVFIISENWKQP